MKRRGWSIFSALALLLGCGGVRANEAATQKYRNYLPEQIESLPEAERQSEVPIMYSQAAATGLSE